MTRPVYTVSAVSGVVPGILLADDGKIAVGEAWRGRRLVSVAVPPGAEVEVREDGPALLLRLPPGARDETVLLVRDQSGYRGSWHARGPRTPAEWAHVIAAKVAHTAAEQAAQAADIDGWLDRLKASGHGDNTRASYCPLCGAGWPIERAPSWRVIAEGACAEGTAGRMGGGPEYLVGMCPGEAVELVRGGRLYGAPAVLRLEIGTDGVPVVSDPLAEATSAAAIRELGGER